MGEDDFAGEGSVVGYAGKFWDAVVAEVIPKPKLLAWNRWQAWRSTEGKGPKGVRGREEQQREVKLRRAAMKEYHGEDWWEVLKTGKSTVAAEGLALGQEARDLFPDVRCTSVGSGPATAPKSSGLLKRVNLLLLDLDSYEGHHDRVVRVCEIGQKSTPRPSLRWWFRWPG